MINVKTKDELECMRRAGAITRDLLLHIEENAKAGVTTARLDTLAYDFIKKHNAAPSFLGYNGFPATICTSIDEQVVHGIPSGRRLEEGQLLKIDAGVCYKGYHGDAARTIEIGKVSPEKHKLAAVAKESFFKGAAILKAGVRTGDLGAAIQKYVESFGFSVVRDLVGHGIGRTVHEDPNVPNFGTEGRGIRLDAGVTLAVEPMINAGSSAVTVLADKWTVVAKDRKPSAHYENTLVITENGVEILTL